jgi:hypothetical protein
MQEPPIKSTDMCMHEAQEKAMMEAKPVISQTSRRHFLM